MNTNSKNLKRRRANGVRDVCFVQSKVRKKLPTLLQSLKLQCLKSEVSKCPKVQTSKLRLQSLKFQSVKFEVSRCEV